MHGEPCAQLAHAPEEGGRRALRRPAQAVHQKPYISLDDNTVA
jgi:hypothetical protein